MIQNFKFGEIMINNKTYNQDLYITKGRVTASWWRQAGHMADIPDVGELLDAEPEILVLGSGTNGRMRVSDALKQLVMEKGITLIKEKTPEAITIFNRLFKEGKNVAAGFHITC